MGKRVFFPCKKTITTQGRISDESGSRIEFKKRCSRGGTCWEEEEKEEE